MRTNRPFQALLAVLFAGVLGIPAAQADGTASVWQYEMGFGGKQTTGTFYLSYQSVDGSHLSFADLDRRDSLRIPLYSTDPKVSSLTSRLVPLMRLDNEDSDPEGGFESVKKAVYGLIGVVVVLGPPVVGMAKTIKELECIPYCPSKGN